MRIAIATVFLLLCCVAPGNAQQPALKGMSAMEIAEALASPTHAIRERGLRELSLMNADTATALGAEITRMGVREAQLCLSAISHATAIMPLWRPAQPLTTRIWRFEQVRWMC